MTRVLLFNLLQIAATLYAFRRGGAPERVVGLALLTAALSTRFALSRFEIRFAGLELGVLAVDLLLLVILVVVALHADRRWVSWVAALHALGTGIHVAQVVSPDTSRLAYAILSAVWSYPIVLILILGTARHARRIAARGWDLDWSRQDPTLRQRRSGRSKHVVQR